MKPKKSPAPLATPASSGPAPLPPSAKKKATAPKATVTAKTAPAAPPKSAPPAPPIAPAVVTKTTTRTTKVTSRRPARRRTAPTPVPPVPPTPTPPTPPVVPPTPLVPTSPPWWKKNWKRLVAAGLVMLVLLACWLNRQSIASAFTTPAVAKVPVATNSVAAESLAAIKSLEKQIQDLKVAKPATVTVITTNMVVMPTNSPVTTTPAKIAPAHQSVDVSGDSNIVSSASAGRDLSLLSLTFNGYSESNQAQEASAPKSSRKVRTIAMPKMPPQTFQTNTVVCEGEEVHVPIPLGWHLGFQTTMDVEELADGTTYRGSADLCKQADQTATKEFVFRLKPGGNPSRLDLNFSRIQ